MRHQRVLLSSCQRSALQDSCSSSSDPVSRLPLWLSVDQIARRLPGVDRQGCVFCCEVRIDPCQQCESHQSRPTPGSAPCFGREPPRQLPRRRPAPGTQGHIPPSVRVKILQCWQSLSGPPVNTSSTLAPAFWLSRQKANTAIAVIAASNGERIIGRSKETFITIREFIGCHKYLSPRWSEGVDLSLCQFRRRLLVRGKRFHVRASGSLTAKAAPWGPALELSR